MRRCYNVTSTELRFMNPTHQGQNWFPMFMANGPITKPMENCTYAHLQTTVV